MPRPGTIAADIYALAKRGLSTGEIAKELGRERNNVGVHLFKIKRPERGNQLGNGWKKKRTREPKPIKPEEAHARKVAGLHQARAIVSAER